MHGTCNGIMIFLIFQIIFYLFRYLLFCFLFICFSSCFRNCSRSRVCFSYFITNTQYIRYVFNGYLHRLQFFNENNYYNKIPPVLTRFVWNWVKATRWVATIDSFCLYVLLYAPRSTPAAHYFLLFVCVCTLYKSIFLL